MRISTSMIFDAGVNAINSQTASLLHLQQQVATGRRMLTPADDPVSAARALEVQQAKDVVAQFAANQSNAKSALGLEEAQLSGVGDLLARVKELTVQAGNAALSAGDRRNLAMELRGRFEELMGIANTTDGAGRYLFAGYMSGTVPFGGAVNEVAAATGEVDYRGDEGHQRLQVSASRYLEISDSGSEIFQRIRTGNGTFTSGYAASNTGTGVVDIGTVTDPAKWNNPANSKNLEIRFWVDTAGVAGTVGATYYDVVDADPASPTFNNSLFTNSASSSGAGGTYSHAYTANQPINLAGLAAPFNDLGASVAVKGAPADGDVFTLKASSNQSIFKTLANLVSTVESNIAAPANQAKFSNEINFALANLDLASENILRVRAAVGSRLSELDSIGAVNEDLNVQYDQTLSNLQDLDYAKAISDLTRKQTDLEAAQKSFMRTSSLSLFNYI